jgi:multiple sugar transport system substrate-binding protein
MSSYYDKVQLMLASGTAPDIIRVNPDHFFSYVRLGFFRDLEPIMRSDPDYHPEDYFAVARDRAVVNGHHFGVGVLFTTTLCYYNKTLFDKAGVKDPWQRYEEGRWNWEDFLDAARKLTVFDEAGRPSQYGTDFRTNVEALAKMVLGNGGKFISDDGRKSLVNSPICVSTIQWVDDLVWKYRVAPTPSQAALSVFSFESGRIAMEIDASGESPRLREAIKSFEWDVAPLPGVSSATAPTHESHILVMNARTKVPEGAWRFMKFMTSPTAERMLGCQLRRCIPTRRDVAFSKEYLSADKPPFHTAAFLEGVDKPQPRIVYDPKWSEWTLEWRSHLDRALLNNEPAQKVMDEAAAKIDLILSGETD